MTEQEIITMYQQQDTILDALSAQESIREKDLDGLNRIGKCRLIDRNWGKILARARQALLNDGHHFVRACCHQAALHEHG